MLSNPKVLRGYEIKQIRNEILDNDRYPNPHFYECDIVDHDYYITSIVDEDLSPLTSMYKEEIIVPFDKVINNILNDPTPIDFSIPEINFNRHESTINNHNELLIDSSKLPKVNVKKHAIDRSKYYCNKSSNVPEDAVAKYIFKAKDKSHFYVCTLRRTKEGSKLPYKASVALNKNNEWHNIHIGNSPELYSRLLQECILEFESSQTGL